MSRKTRLKTLLSALPFALGLALAPGTATANPYADNLTARVLPGWRGADGRHVAGLELRLAKGWKTYWRSPGESGVPPLFSWAGSGNLANLQVIWPRPEVFDQNGLRSIGYADRIVLPLIITPATAGAPVELNGAISLGICDEVCVPLDLHLTGTLPASGGQRDPAIAAALAARPYSPREAKVRAVDCTIAPARNGMALSVNIAMPSTGGNEVIVVETSDPQIWASDSRSHRSGGQISAQTELFHSSGGAFALDRSALTITVLGGQYAVEISGCGN
ncbi:protein-disulfide reductase DsbD domain-containing protein [Pseudooceanicola sp.]|uniref:protein-disulfide reductase DsbD domain-containing protein n=1 Tax=Pseudooceanicola sp. TaxID=1914328 RepID=UPI0026383029|nr:protein-disulfide reductase DsbD domain-containing protein [Pseudooceanicola sp.]MDF1855338.1 protein-disulfide reductase DsbD family protein [Pseudooceanicola sp.]